MYKHNIFLYLYLTRTQEREKMLPAGGGNPMNSSFAWQPADVWFLSAIRKQRQVSVSRRFPFFSWFVPALRPTSSDAVHEHAELVLASRGRDAGGKGEGVAAPVRSTPGVCKLWTGMNIRVTFCHWGWDRVFVIIIIFFLSIFPSVERTFSRPLAAKLRAHPLHSVLH